MRRNKIIAVVLALLMVGLAGCSTVGGGQGTAEAEPDSTEDTREFNPDSGQVTRFVDEEAGVVCYKFKGFEKGGLSCIPIDETQLYEGSV